MKNLLVLLLLINTVVFTGCAATEKNITVSSDVYKPKMMDHWLFTMYPKQNQSQNLDMYKINYTYQGDIHATNVTVKFGNGIVKTIDIAKDQGGTVGSTFATSTKQLELTINWTENDHSYSDSLTFNTGQ